MKKSEIHEYDYVQLKDGREASIVYIMGGPYFIADVGSSPADWETILITLDDIERIIRSSKE